MNVYNEKSHNFKMKIEDPVATWEKFKEMAGESHIPSSDQLRKHNIAIGKTSEGMLKNDSFNNIIYSKARSGMSVLESLKNLNLKMFKK
jgi:hypothetical protein